jgi:branched-chain amino acid transport system permease protein
MMAGYISSHYKDAVAFVLILLILFFMPTGMFGKQSAERV